MLAFVFFFFVFSSSLASRVSFVELGLHEEEVDKSRFLLTRNEVGELEYVDLLSQNVTHYAEEDDVIFHLYTKDNINNDEVLTVDNYATSEYFNPDKQTLFIIHGWRNDYQSNVNKLVKSTALKYFDINVFVVDWSYAAKRNYITARLSVKTVGRTVAKFISNLANDFLIEITQFSLIGHSLGAHVAGDAGAALDGQLNYIVGLDPAGPLFSLRNTESRLDPTDANYVEVIHTSFMLGFGTPLGHTDFYPNGGNRQPGCGFDLDNTCAHSRSYEYYADSLKIRFLGHQCTDYEDFEAGLCNYNKVAVMGQVHVDKRARGRYYLRTNKKEPYAMNISQ